MKVTLDLRKNTYTESRKHFQNILDCWSFIQWCERHDTVDLLEHVPVPTNAEDSAADSYAWFEQYMPWVIPQIDRAIINMLTL